MCNTFFQSNICLVYTLLRFQIIFHSQYLLRLWYTHYVSSVHSQSSRSHVIKVNHFSSFITFSQRQSQPFSNFYHISSVQFMHIFVSWKSLKSYILKQLKIERIDKISIFPNILYTMYVFTFGSFIKSTVLRPSKMSLVYAVNICEVDRVL